MALPVTWDAALDFLSLVTCYQHELTLFFRSLCKVGVETLWLRLVVAIKHYICLLNITLQYSSGTLASVDSKNIDDVDAPTVPKMSGIKPAEDLRRIIKASDASARAYLEREKDFPSLHQGEVNLVERALASLGPLDSLIDLPCGAGRMIKPVARHGLSYTGGDPGEEILEYAKKEAKLVEQDCDLWQLDAMDTGLPDQAFDCALCFRFFHHLRDQHQQKQLVKELCRISKSYVIISYFDAFSFSAYKNRVRTAVTGFAPKKFEIKRQVLMALFADEGYEMVDNFARVPFFHRLNLAVFKRVGPVA